MVKHEGSTSTDERINCLISFLAEDRREAVRLCTILDAADFHCRLHSSAASGLNGTADTADCTLVLITAKLLDDRVALQRIENVFWRYVTTGRAERFIPVLANIKNEIVECDDKLGFLSSRGKIRARWDNVDFRQELIYALESSVGLSEFAPRISVSKPQQITNSSSQELNSNDRKSPFRADHICSSCLSKMNSVPSDSCDIGANDEPALTTNRQSSIPRTSQKNCSKVAWTLEQTDNADRPNVTTSSTVDQTLTFPIPCSEAVESTSGGSQRSLVGSGCMGNVYLCDYTVRGRHSSRTVQVARKIIKPSVTCAQSFHGNTWLTKLRSPWLLPILDVDFVTFSGNLELHITTPYMPKGNLKELLKRNVDISIYQSAQAHRVSLLYQITAGVDFLHAQRIVHGAISPRNILLDGVGNSRLSDIGQVRSEQSKRALVSRAGYRDPYVERNSNSNAWLLGCPQSDDVFSLGIIGLQLLKWNPPLQWTICNRIHRSKTLFEHLTDDNRKLPSASELSQDQRFVDPTIWPKDNVTQEVADLVISCLTPPSVRPSSYRILENIRQVAGLVQNCIPFIHSPERSCVYCTVEDRMKDTKLQLRSSCPAECVFTKTCHNCAISFRCRKCSSHGDMIHPPLGGEQSCALIISGRDKEDRDFEVSCSNDAFAMKEVAVHPRIFNIPANNVFLIDSHNATEAYITSTIDRILTKIQPDYFLFYYSGHDEFDSDSRPRLDVSDEQGSALDLEHLRTYFGKLRCKCSRMLLILDCCSAENAQLLLSNDRTNDKDSEWRIQWSSCRSWEESGIDDDDFHSTFTKYVLSALRGTSYCPNTTEACQICKKYSDACLKNRSVFFGDLSEYVEDHMKEICDQNDKQTPSVDIRGSAQQIVAYFVDGPLYTFTFQLPNGAQHQCTLQSLGTNMHDIRTRLCDQLRHLGFTEVDPDRLYQAGMPEVSFTNVDDILKANANDDRSLFVTLS